MNWAKGLLRLWVVLSLFWLIAVFAVLEVPQNAMSAFNNEIQPTDLTASDVEVVEESDGLLTIQHGTMKFEVGKDDVDLTSQTVDERGAMLEELVVEFNKQAAIANAQNRRSMSELRTGVIVAALPPVFILVLGGALLWAARGFKKDRP